MTKKKLDKRIPEIEPKFDHILVLGEKKSAPFIEILFQEPENITSHNLGNLIGILEVTDSSDDSSYIVNYLISVIKKEYFSKPKRGPVESLEAALHKANLALSKLAEHGNVDWLGKLNALIAVTEKNNLHLSQAGTASAFLLRSKNMTDISDGLSTEEAEPHPLKTFVNVSSGRLELDDKLIITTGSIFNIFSPEELKKSALRFSNRDFVQFLKTALSNELERVAVLVIDMGKKTEIPIEPAARIHKETNVFSQTAFIKSSSSKPGTSEGTEKNVENEIKNEIKIAQTEFIDEKTGHIYIKEDFYAKPQDKNQTEFIKSALTSLGFAAKKMALFLSTISKNARAIRLPQKTQVISAPAAKPQGPTAKDIINKKIRSSSAAMATSSKKIVSGSAEITRKIFSSENRVLFISVFKKIFNNAASAIAKLMPNFNKIKEITHKMDYQQRLYAALAVVLILAVPFFAIKIKNASDAKKASLLAEQNRPVALPLEQDKNVLRVPQADAIYSGENIILGLVNLNGKAFAVTSANVFDIEANKAFALPQDFDAPEKMVGMDDLNLIFLMNKNNRIISLNPTSGKFQENNIAIPEDSNISAIGTYLTYIYLVDAKNNQIYRYPRAEGGFGEKTNWLKDTVDLSGTIDLAMNDSIFLTNSTNITKLFKGKKQDFNIEETATPIEINKIALGQAGTIYILDTKNSRVIRLDAENKIVAQYYNMSLHDANSFTVDEANNLFYFSNISNVQTLSLN